jgi:hypothetical protein
MKAPEPEVFDRVAGGEGEAQNNLLSGAESDILKGGSEIKPLPSHRYRQVFPNRPK